MTVGQQRASSLSVLNMPKTRSEWNEFDLHPGSFLLLSSPGVITLTVFFWLCPCDRPPTLLLLSPRLGTRLSSPLFVPLSRSTRLARSTALLSTTLPSP